MKIHFCYSHMHLHMFIHCVNIRICVNMCICTVMQISVSVNCFKSYRFQAVSVNKQYTEKERFG